VTPSAPHGRAGATPERLRAIVTGGHGIALHRLRTYLRPTIDVALAPTEDAAAELAAAWPADLIVTANDRISGPDDPSLVVVVLSHDQGEARATATVHVNRASTFRSIAPLLVALARYALPESASTESNP